MRAREIASRNGRRTRFERASCGDDLNSPKTSGARLLLRLLSQVESRRPLTFPILSPGRTVRCATPCFSSPRLFLPVSRRSRRCPPTRFRTPSWKLSCSVGFVATAYQVASRWSSLRLSTVPLSSLSISSVGFPGLLVARGELFFHFGRPPGGSRSCNDFVVRTFKWSSAKFDSTRSTLRRKVDDETREKHCQKNHPEPSLNCGHKRNHTIISYISNFFLISKIGLQSDS